MTTFALAQTPAPTPGTKTPVVKQRQKNQQRRIGQGVASGELKAGEVKKLEQQQQEVNQMKHEAKADGTVTGAERKDILKEQNQTSRQVYRAKHNNRKRN
ncbi:MAG: hypothetical protein HOP19_09390 [Acidobacteria bacterium]|nr:hypothetical protein [Acidobacteriota bacterium]